MWALDCRPGSRAKCSGGPHAHLRLSHNSPAIHLILLACHNMQPGNATKLCQLTDCYVVAGDVRKPREGQEHADNDEGEAEGGEQGAGGDEVEPRGSAAEVQPGG